jgi:SAM-dependent methyltransferase
MNRKLLVEHLDKSVSRRHLIGQFCKGKSVLDIGCVNHNIDNTILGNWLHENILHVADKVLGVDLLEDEIAELKKQGYDVLAADVSKPLGINETFDVVVVGNLIEHLSNFDGLMLNIEKLLHPKGKLLISTANPFYREQYFYSAFKNDILVNAEHTCWIDPVTLDQLSCRYGFTTESVFWIKEKWYLSQTIMNGTKREFDIMTGKWLYHASPSAFERLLTLPLELAFRLFLPGRAKTIAQKHGSHMSRILYIKFVSWLFGIFWAFYRQIIVTAPLNRYELFMSVLKRSN